MFFIWFPLSFLSFLIINPHLVAVDSIMDSKNRGHTALLALTDSRRRSRINAKVSEVMVKN